MICIPLKTVSGMNAREHWRQRARRVKAEREAVGWAVATIKPPKPPCTVTLTRLAPSSGLDSDNLQSSQKAVRDALAQWIGIDDKSPLVAWVYRQDRAKEYSVTVEVTS